MQQEQDELLHSWDLEWAATGCGVVAFLLQPRVRGCDMLWCSLSWSGLHPGLLPRAQLSRTPAANLAPDHLQQGGEGGRLGGLNSSPDGAWEGRESKSPREGFLAS